MEREEPLNEAYLLAGGPQGGGIDTLAQVIAVAFAVSGYGVFVSREYHSNIRGRHSYITVTVSTRKVPSHISYPFHAAAFMDAESVFTHYDEVAAGSILVYDRGVSRVRLDSIPSMSGETRRRLAREYSEKGIEPIVDDVVRYMESKGARIVALDFQELLEKLRVKHGVARHFLGRYTSAILAGALAGASGLSLEALEEGFRFRFRGGGKLVEHNLYLAGLAWEEVREQAGTIGLGGGELGYGEVFVVTGNEAVAMAKVAAGIRFQSYYPITPAQDESFYLESHERLEAEGESLGSIILLQTEDEIAAIASAIGAALAGARAATATSGPGYDLMVEGLSWAWMNETPVLLTLYQRGGPSTGLPTRSGQEDLLAALFASHGSVPRIVIASGDHLEAFMDVFKAANIAEKYQVPVIHLLDKFLANSISLLPPSNNTSMVIERGMLSLQGPVAEGYKRFDRGKGPVSLRIPLGYSVAWYTGAEHDEYGHVVEEPATRLAMVSKRMAKLALADREIPERGERALLYPSNVKPSGIDVLLVGWGSVKGVAIRAVEELVENGVRAAYLHLRYFMPFPSRYVYAIIKGVKMAGGLVVAVEHNYQAQAARIIEMFTGLVLEHSIVKYTGRPIYLRELLEAVEAVRVKGARRVVLAHGA